MSSTLSDTISEQLKNGTYECVICVATIKHMTATWSCPSCYRLYHMFCIKKWAREGGINPDSSAPPSGGVKFQCPTCKATAPIPKNYLCFCGKVIDPAPTAYNVPHSCGDSCGKKRGGQCLHPCPSQCHPGPCPPCLIPTPTPCHCGSVKETLPCSEAEKGLTCGKPCSKPLMCGVHTCSRTCHPGSCAQCPIANKVLCPCGSTQHVVSCGKSAPTCANTCSKKLSCGQHSCSLKCHHGACEECPHSPARQKTCNCGKKPLPSATLRTKCTDPIPSCGSVCGKLLKCGTHKCEQTCHEGDCPDCDKMGEAPCPCGSTRHSMPCIEICRQKSGAVPCTVTCNKKCGLKLKCGRHFCSVVCCPKRPFGSADHPCEMICNRRLLCSHKCPEPCHDGPCPPCLHFIAHDLTCTCGKTTLHAPQPCGTQIPSCSYPCTLPRTTCDHPIVAHQCHTGACPPCVARIDKLCVGGHITMKVNCSAGAVTCGSQCGKPLLPCRHLCERGCHEDECLARGYSCQQDCVKQYETCSHACKAKCHYGKPCPPCSEKIPVKCSCGAKSVEYPCGKAPTTEETTIPCDDECFQVNRLAALKEQSGRDLFGSSGTSPTDVYYSTKLWNAIKTTRDAVMTTERTFTEFLQSSEQHLLLPNMTKDRRAIVHELAQFYGILTSSMPGPPEKKSVDLAKTSGTRTPPILLSEAVEKRPDLNPATFLKESTKFPNRVIIFDECPEGNFPALYYALRPFVGQFVLWEDAKKKYTACVFVNERLAQDAYSHLRRNGTLPVVFHWVGKAPPPRTLGGGADNKGEGHKDPTSEKSVATRVPKSNYDKEVGKPKPKNTAQNRFSGLK